LIIKTLLSSTFKVLAFTLALSVLFPSAIKLSHAFNHHEHEVCDIDNEQKTHFHELDLDCDFYKFKLSKNQFFVFSETEEKPELPYLKENLEYYISFHNHQQLLRFLRGPPQLV